MTEDQYNEMLRLLLADIEAMAPLVFPHGIPVAEANIRMLASFMRRWLVDGDLQKILSVTQSTANFNVLGNSQAVKYADESHVFRYFLTGGIRMKSGPVQYLYESPLKLEEIDLSFVKQGRIRLPLKKFLSQRRLMHEGQWFTAEEIIRFVANKLGGNHTDFVREGIWEKLDAANRWLAYGGPQVSEPPPGTEIYLIFEPDSDEVIGGVHLELIAIAASFVQMEIDNQPLQKMISKSTWRSLVKKVFSRKSRVTMVDFRTER